MRQDYLPRFVDPKSLNLKEYSLISTHNAEVLSAEDDVAIASGQAGFDYSEKGYMDMWSNPQNHAHQIDSFELGDMNFCSTQATQARNAATTVWDTERFAPNSLPDSVSSCPVEIRGSWSHTEMLASVASSPPCLTNTTSRRYPNGWPSQSPPQFQEQGSFGSFQGSHKHHDASPLQQRMLHESQSAQNTFNEGYSGRLPHAARQHSGTSQSNSFLRDHTTIEEDRSKVEVSQSSASSSLLLDDQPMPRSLTSSTIESLPVPRGDEGRELRMEGTDHGTDYTAEWPNEGIGWGLTGEFWQNRSEDLDFLTGGEPFWENSQSSNFGAGGMTSSANTRYELPGQDSGPNSQTSPPNDFYGADNEPSHDATATSSVNYPGAIEVPRSSKQYDPSLTSSFPPTAGHYPDFVPTFSIATSNKTTLPNPLPTMMFPKHRSLPMRRKTSKTKATGRSRSGSLRTIQEHEQIFGTSPTGSLRGRRKGRLDPATAFAASQKRFKGTVCIRCKMMKQKCEGNLPCEGCQKNSNARSWGQPCNRAKFVGFIEAGTCNAVFQRSASVSSIDRKRRTYLSYTGGFDTSVLIDCLRTRRSQHNIRVCQFSGSSYTLDLAKLHKLMLTVQNAMKIEICELDDFGNPRTSKATDWLECVTGYDRSAGVLVGQCLPKCHNLRNDLATCLRKASKERSIMWNNMPSRNVYSFLPVNGDPPRPMDVDDERDRNEILFAVHLCRIILRALEINAFRTLQKQINELHKNRYSSTEIRSLAKNLLEILLSLRWRISWWAVVGVSSNIEDGSKDRYTERVSMLTQTLYFWYFVVRNRLPASETSNGTWNLYADAARRVFDDFPVDESIDGFHAWMARGHGLIHRANVQPSLPQPFSSY